jgi:hypothetical protein
MTQKTNAPIREYFYLDVSGIDRLYNQVAEQVEAELIASHPRTKRKKIDMGTGLGNLIGALFGLQDVGLRASFDALQTRMEESKSQLKIENKLSQLMAYLRKRGGEYFEDLPSAAAKVSETQQKAYICAADVFDAPQFYSHGLGARDVNASEAITFAKSASEYDPSDSYFKNGPYSFVMNAGVRNLTRLGRGRMGITSHEAVFFRDRLGKRIPLYVFGSMKHLSKLMFQIKPYAIEAQGRPR